MTEPWLFAETPATLAATSVTVMEGTTFCIGDGAGDLGGVDPGGLFVRDTRVLLVWDLVVAGRRAAPLTVHHESPYSVVHVGHLRLPSAEGAQEVLVTRHRVVGDGMREEIGLVNCSGRACRVDLRLLVGADLADLFEVKDGRVPGRPLPTTVERHNHLRVDGDRASGSGVVIVPDDAAVADAGSLLWSVELEPHQAWTTDVEVLVRVGGELLAALHPRGLPASEALPFQRRADWWAAAPTLETPDRRTREVLRTSVEDLGSLRIMDPAHPDQQAVAAGAPWFMALFGRDSLISSLMLLPLAPDLALGTCRALAAHQGRERVDVTEEEAGRILHELRLGPAGTLALGGGSAYFGSVDATPLFVMTMGEILRWCGPEAVTPDLMGAVDRALDWIARSSDHEGFLSYARMTPQGLRNQGWKDSWDGVNFADGRLAEAPIALAEVQGYVYAALLARATLAEALEGGRGADTWRRRADDLKERFDERFWLPELGWFASALDRDERPVDALTSALGHLLWTGIVDSSRADRVAELLLSPELFSGWGVRTLATSMARYDPLSYHNGSVWPHDTAIAVSGLARYGYHDGAAQVADGLLDASLCFEHRLPELFGGFARGTPTVPVPYPAACAPQAWAAAAPVELLRALIGLTPADDGLACTPFVPHGLLPLRLDGVRSRGASYLVEVASDGRHRVRRRT